MLKIAYVGRFAEPKNNLILIDIAKSLSQLSVVYNIDIFGDAEPGDNKGIAIKNEFNELLQASDYSIVCHGFSSNIQKVLIDYDFLVLPSHWEGWPMVMIEAASVGCIPICSDIFTGPREFIAGLDDYTKKIDYPFFGSGGVLLSCPVNKIDAEKWALTMKNLHEDKVSFTDFKVRVFSRAAEFSFASYSDKWIKNIRNLLGDN